MLISIAILQKDNFNFKIDCLIWLLAFFLNLLFNLKHNHPHPPLLTNYKWQTTRKIIFFNYSWKET